MGTTQADSSFNRRYVAKLLSNVVGLAVSLVNLWVVPRTLGPSSYGRFEFLTSFFQNLIQVWDPGTSTAFFTKLSRRNNDAGLLRFYARYVVAVGALIFAAMVAIALTDVEAVIWPEQEWSYVLAAAGLAYVVWISGICQKVVDGFGLTVSGEFLLLAIRIVGGLAVIGLFVGGWLDLTTLFVKELVLYFSIAVGLSCLAFRHWARYLSAQRVNTDTATLASEFWVYCAPLVAYSVAGMGVGLVDRWMLQKFSGSTEQGFYGLAYRLAAVSLVFSVAMTQLLQREFSRAHGELDTARMRHLFERYIPVLYTVTACIAAFAFIQSHKIVSLVGGPDFAGAMPATMLMTLYPVHQTYGQLSGSFFLATDRTALYRNIGFAHMSVGLLVTWFALAPREYWGLEAGSLGLAVKMVLLQFLQVNLQLWFNLRKLELSFSKFLTHQVVVVGLFLGLAWAADWIAAFIGGTIITSLLGSGICYTLMVGGVWLRWPEIAAMSRQDVRRLLSRITPR